jgi:hypothetical protein
MGLIRTITSPTGRDGWLRKTCLSVCSNAVRFFPRGVCSGIPRPRRLRIRRNSKPRNPKLSPCVRFTRRLFSSFTSTCSFASSSRSRCSTAVRSQRCRGWASTNTTRSSAKRVFDVRPLVARDGLRLLQHAVDLGEVDVFEQGRHDAALRNALPARRFQNQSEEPQHRVIA